MATEAEFQLDRRIAVYQSGEILRGRIVLKTVMDKIVKGVTIVFLGAAKVDWVVTRHANYNIIHDHHVNYQEFVHSPTQVFEAGVLPAGIHTYTFNVQIPATCITTCQDKCGEVSYKLKLLVDTVKGQSEAFELCVTVTQPLNLNWEPTYRVPLRLEHSKQLCCLPCRGGSIDASLTLPYGGFVPGQDLCYTFDVHNRSHSLRMKGYEIQLLQEYTYLSDLGETKQTVNQLCAHREAELVHCDAVQCFRGSLRIPQVPPTTPTAVPSVIRVDYMLRLELCLGMWHIDPKIDLPVIIGTVPVLGSELYTTAAATSIWQDHYTASTSTDEVTYYTLAVDPSLPFYPNFSKPLASTTVRTENGITTQM